MTRKIRVGKIIRIAWISLGLGFMIWNWSTFQSRGVPRDTFTSSATLEISEDDDKITFRPLSSDNDIEVIFLQGGLTDPEAYGPLCRKIAESGFTCHLMKMAWRLPQSDYEKIFKLFDLGRGKYVIGGHSQGGKTAAQIVYEKPDDLRGLFLLGTSSPRDIDLSALSIPTLKIYGENDGLASVQEVLQYQPHLPRDSRLVMLNGANHSQFGYLGQLFLDNAASISVEEQQRETLNELTTFFRDLSNGLAVRSDELK